MKIPVVHQMIIFGKDPPKKVVFLVEVSKAIADKFEDMGLVITVETGLDMASIIFTIGESETVRISNYSLFDQEDLKKLIIDMIEELAKPRGTAK